MKKINLTPFNVTIRIPDGTTKELPYGLRESMVEILFQPILKLNNYNLIKQEDLARKIIAAGNELILDDEEYARLKVALEKIEGWGKNDVEMVKRIMNAESVSEETKPA